MMGLGLSSIRASVISSSIPPYISPLYLRHISPYLPYICATSVISSSMQRIAKRNSSRSMLPPPSASKKEKMVLVRVRVRVRFRG